MTKIAVALYDDYAPAQETLNELLDAGIARSDISVTSHASHAMAGGGAGAGTSGQVGTSDNTEGPLGEVVGYGGSLLEKLTDLGVPRDEAEIYAEGVRRGGSLVLVRADDARAEEAASIMEGRRAVDYETRSASWRAEGWTGYEASAYPFTTEEADLERQRYADLRLSEDYAQEHRTAGETVVEGETTRQTTGEEGVIPVVEEELQVGKRATRRGVRVHTTVHERPVEETVRLRDEDVRVERRAVDRPVTGAEAEAAFRETDIEVEETHEQAVVSKEARVVEEVVVDKEAREREEVVRDTVRRTDVDVEETTPTTPTKPRP
jgi:stress response protein YsnF